MNTPHTKEPWFVREAPDGSDCIITAEREPGMAYGPEIMGDDYTGYGGLERKKADARRITACVNACKGYKIRDLEETGSYGVMLIRLAHERDELLAALRNLVSVAKVAKNNDYQHMSAAKELLQRVNDDSAREESDDD